jgi:molecular chaperone DnaK
VTAKDKATNKEQQIRIQASGGLSDADIEKMVKDAEANAESDKKRRALVEAKNQAESLIHSTEKSIRDLGDKAPAADKDAVEAATADLRTALEGEDAEEISSKTQVLAQAAMKIGEAMYAQSQSGGSGESESDTGADGVKEDVVDADFEEVDDDEKKSA